MGFSFFQPRLFKFASQLFVAGFSLSVLPGHALVLSEYVADAINAHPTIQEQVHVFREVSRDRDIARSGWHPSVDLQASAGTYQTETPLTGPSQLDYESNRAELSVTQNLFNGFDTSYQLDQTMARINSALYEIYDTADNIALEAVQAYLEVLKQRKLYELAQQNVTSHESILSQIRERSNSGVGRRSQLQQTEGRVARAHASLIAQQNNLQDAATQFHEILGRYIPSGKLVEPKLPPHPSGSLDELIDQALLKHPAIRVASFNIEAAQFDYRRSKSANYPSVDLRLAKEVGDDINGLIGETDNLSLVLNLNYNLYNGGADKAARQKKISVVHQQQEFATRVRRQVINTLRLAWVADQSLTQQIKFLKQHIIKSRETVASYREEFFIGQRDLIDLLDAENELNSARNQHTEAHFQVLAARYRIHEGIGSLFDAMNLHAKVGNEDLHISRIKAQGEDVLPLVPDRDLDMEKNRYDHCDNTLKNDQVNEFGCHNRQQIRFGYEQVNAEPRLGDDELEMESNSVLLIAQDVLLANDTDEDGDTLSLVDFSQPKHGKLALDKSKNLIYRAAEGFVGTDNFTYSVKDGKGAVVSAKVILIVVEPTEVELSKIQYVNFIFNKADLTDASKVKVRHIVRKIKEMEFVKVEIYAYTDNVGSDSYNLALSQRRAQAMRELLITQGLDGANIKAYGMGEKNPIADNSTPEGKAINRRGEFRFILSSSRASDMRYLLARESQFQY